MFLSYFTLNRIHFLVFLSRLWDQFHILRTNLAVAYWFALLFSFVSEIEAIRTDRHLNIIFSALQQFWYITSAYLILAETLATFRAITSGIIGGKTMAYVPLAYGLGCWDLGITILLYNIDYGRDPRAFIGWENETKTVFFYGMYGAAGVRTKHNSIIV